MLRSLLTDLGEVGTVVSKNELKKPESPAAGAGEAKVEEEFTVARLYVSKMKSEVKNLVNKASMFEAAQGELTYRMKRIDRARTIFSLRVAG